MSIRLVAAAALLLAVVAVAVYGFRQGTSLDVVNAVRTGDVEGLTRALARDPAAVHTKVYPQAHERLSERLNYEQRTGRSAWEGKYLIHEAVSRVVEPVPMLDALADKGADLAVRLNGRTLLHLAANSGNLEAAAWLLDHGADPNTGNDCGGCDERGQTALHDGLAFNDDEMSVLLLDRGARVTAADDNGRTALHAAAALGKLSGAFVLCRYGADPAAADAAGRTPHDLALAPASGSDPGQPRPEEAAQLARWLKPGGGCGIVAASARTQGAPVADAAARKVFADTVFQE